MEWLCSTLFRRICAPADDQSRSFRRRSSIVSVVYFPSLISWFLQFSSPFIMMFCSSSVSLILYFFIILSTDPFLIFLHFPLKKEEKFQTALGKRCFPKFFPNFFPNLAENTVIYDKSCVHEL